MIDVAGWWSVTEQFVDRPLGFLGVSGVLTALVVDLFLLIIYFPFFWSTTGATPGQRVLGLRVVAADGSQLSATKSAVRFLGLLVSFTVLGLGVIWIAFDKHKQGWHDKLAATLVIREDRTANAPLDRSFFGVFWERVVAALVDGIIMSVPFIALLFVSAGLAGIGLAEIRQVAQGNATYFLPLMFVFFIATNVAVTVYHVYFWTTSGATPGKSLLGLRVVSRDLSRRVNMWEALLRFFGYWVSALLLLGYVFVIWDRDKQAWHDRIARTYVVKQ